MNPKNQKGKRKTIIALDPSRKTVISNFKKQMSAALSNFLIESVFDDQGCLP
jgi:hypothetical protein